MDIFVGTNKFEQHIVITDCRDALPPEITHFAVLTSTADPDNLSDMSERFWRFYDHARFVEKLGFTVTLGIGQIFYETGSEVDVRDS